MHIRSFIPLVAGGLLLGPVQSIAQTTTTTTCDTYSPYSVSCNSHTSADLSAQIKAQNEATSRSWNEFFAILQARRDRNAAFAQQQQATATLAAEREAIISAERGRQAAAESRESARDDAARTAEDARKAEEDARIKARLDLFTQRADFIRGQTLKRIPLIGIPLFDYQTQTGLVLSKLFVANSLATNAEIKEALEPVDTKFAELSATFMQRFRKAVTLTADQYKIPPRDFSRFRDAAWVEALELYRFDIKTSPLIMREVVDLAARRLVKSPEPVGKQ